LYVIAFLHLAKPFLLIEKLRSLATKSGLLSYKRNGGQLKIEIKIKEKTFVKIEEYLRRKPNKTLSDFFEDAANDFINFLELIEYASIKEMNDEIEEYKEKFLGENSDAGKN